MIFERISRGWRRVRRALCYAACRCTGRPAHLHIENRWRLGDEILALPFYRLVQKAFPKDRITVGVNRPELIETEGGLTVDCQVGEFDCDRYLFARDDMRNVPRLQHLCTRHRIPYTHLEPEITVDQEWMPDGVTIPDGAVAYSCGAGWTCKSWLPKAAGELADLITRHTTHNIAFVQLGIRSPDAGVGLDLRDRLDLRQTASVLSRCRLYIGPDSGLVHLALAVGTPTVGLYGPVRPRKAFGERHALHPVISPVACRGCWTDGRMRVPGHCPLDIPGDDPGDFPCMRWITADRVWECIEHEDLLADRT